MKIIYYSDDVENKFVLKNILSEITENDSLIQVFGKNSYRELILNNIVSLQKEVDCIICDSTDTIEKIISPREIIDITKNLPENISYSNRDFKAISIPLILVIKDSLDIFTAREYGFNAILKINNIDEFNKVNPLVISEVKKWRKTTLDELDNLGIKFNRGSIDYDSYDFKKKRNKSTKNLSLNFLQLPRKLNYYWTAVEKEQISKGIDKFWKILKRYEKNNKLRQEKDIHKFLNKNKFFLRRDIYKKYWYEPYFEDLKNEENDKEPDYALKPTFSFKTELSIVEVKLPTERFIVKKRTHKTFYKNIYDYLEQVSNYKDYLESEQYQEYVYKTLKENPKEINYKLLLGRQKDKEENLYHIEKLMGRYSYANVELLTFDELIDLQIKLLTQLELMEVR